MKEEPKTPIQIAPPTPLARWLGAIPLFSMFVMASKLAAEAQYVKNWCYRLNIELALPTRWAFSAGFFLATNYWLLTPAMFVLCWLHFSWASKNSKRLLWFNTLWFSIFMFGLLLFCSLYISFMIIISGMRKK